MTVESGRQTCRPHIDGKGAGKGERWCQHMVGGEGRGRDGVNTW